MSRGWTNLLTRDDIVAKLKAFVLALPAKKEQLLQMRITLRKIFADGTLPTELEIGCGKGEFIAHKSLCEPQTNFLGIETKKKRIVSIVQKLDLAQNKNVQLLQLFLDKESINILPTGSFQKIYINYPDPWPKAKHNKHRLINKEFIAFLPALLQENGVLQIITDDQNYAQQIKETLENEKRLTELSKEKQVKMLENRKSTYFETLKLKQGFAPNFFLYQKI